MSKVKSNFVAFPENLTGMSEAERQGGGTRPLPKFLTNHLLNASPPPQILADQLFHATFQIFRPPDISEFRSK